MGKLRQAARALSQKVRQGDPDAARELLSHSVRMGHEKLALRRYFIAVCLGARDLADEERYCTGVAATLPAESVRRMAAEASTEAKTYAERRERKCLK